MKIAQEKKENNIGEYVLYMWQIEDLIRAYNFDISELERKVYGVFSENEQERLKIQAWYSDILQMMDMERVQKVGHLQITINVILDLNTLHVELVKDSTETEYREIYYKASPNLYAFESKIKNKDTNEVEMMFMGLYGLLMMRIGGKTISQETEQAMQTFSNLIALLVKKYHNRENDEKTKFRY